MADSFRSGQAWNAHIGREYPELLGWTLKSDQTLPAIFQPRDFLLQIIETDADHIVLCIPAQEWSIVRSMLFLGRCLEALDDQLQEFINSLDRQLTFGDFDELHIGPVRTIVVEVKTVTVRVGYGDYTNIKKKI